MTDDALRQTVAQLARPVVSALGLCIWGVEIVRGGRTCVRLFVDVPLQDSASESAGSHRNEDQGDTSLREAPPDGSASASCAAASPTSASIDQCEEISRQLGLALDVEDCIPESWVLEVSSPGFSRRFFTLDQLRAHTGDMVELRLDAPLTGHAAGPAGRRIWRGQLLGVDGDMLELEPCSLGQDGVILPEAPPVLLPWAAVQRASRIPVFSQPARPGRQRAQGRRKKGSGHTGSDRQA